jgi:hypothetical protein
MGFAGHGMATAYRYVPAGLEPAPVLLMWMSARCKITCAETSSRSMFQSLWDIDTTKELLKPRHGYGLPLRFNPL